MYTRHYLIKIVLLSAIYMMLPSCSSEKESDSVIHDGKNMTVHFGLPNAITTYAIEDLEAYLMLDGGRHTTLLVNTLDKTISGSVKNVSPGTYELAIVYFVIRSGFETQLATVSKAITVAAGQTTQVNIVELDLFRNIDTDNDGFTNLAEVSAGSNPHDSISKPATGGGTLRQSLAEASYGETGTTSVFTQGRIGETFIGTTQNSIYTLSSGFEQ